MWLFRYRQQTWRLLCSVAVSRRITWCFTILAHICSLWYSFGDRKRANVFYKRQTCDLVGFFVKVYSWCTVFGWEHVSCAFLACGGHYTGRWLRCVCYYCSKSIWGLVLGINIALWLNSIMTSTAWHQILQKKNINLGLSQDFTESGTKYDLAKQ